MKTMEVLVVIAFLVAIGPLALVAGADSRPKDTRDTTRWFPSSR